MVRRSSFVIGLGLALLLVDRAQPQSQRDHALVRRGRAPWWRSRSAASSTTRVETNPANALGPALLGLGLAALWIVGIASRQPAWVAWVQLPVRRRLPRRSRCMAAGRRGASRSLTGQPARQEKTPRCECRAGSLNRSAATCGRRRRSTACGNPRDPPVPRCPAGCRTRTARARRLAVERERGADAERNQIVVAEAVELPAQRRSTRRR